MPVTEQGQEQVSTLYDSPEGQLGPILFGGHMHWGYWDDSNRDADFSAGAEKLAEIMIAKTQIGPGQSFVDLGCGVGLSGMRLARAKGCRVEGLTISSFQQCSAMATAKEQGLLDQVNFAHGDARDLPYADRSFDGGWFFESIFHMGHREALREAGRVLKPGAILTLTDLPALAHTTDEFRAFAEQHIHSRFVATEDYPALLKEAGFELLEIDDITDKVMPQLVAKLTETLAAHEDQILALIAEPKKATADWLYLFEYMSENLGYIVVTARKL